MDLDVEELRAEVVATSLTVELEDLVRILPYRCGHGQVSQAYGTSVILAMKQDKEFRPSLSCCVAPTK